MAAKRAHQLNEKGISILSPNTRKTAAVALEEVVEGQVGQGGTDCTTETSDDLLIFDADIDDVVESDDDLEEMQPGNFAEEAAAVDPDEPEEGL